MSRVHQASVRGPPSSANMPRSPVDPATASITSTALKCGTQGTVKPKWNRAESRMAASPRETSTCTLYGACR